MKEFQSVQRESGKGEKYEFTDKIDFLYFKTELLKQTCVGLFPETLLCLKVNS